MTTAGTRPAFYALERGGWRDYVTLLHPPYTAWHLSYVALGAGLAPHVDAGRLVASLAAFALAVGVAAHCLDELRGRPLRTQVPGRTLVALSVASLTGAVALGLVGVAVVGPWLLAFVLAGVVLVLGYNLELGGGRLHHAAGFALGWGGFPVLCGAFAQSGRVTLAALLGAAFAVTGSLAQRRLSTWARGLRRQEGLVEPPAEAALRLLAAAHVLLAAALLATHA